MLITKMLIDQQTLEEVEYDDDDLFVAVIEE